MATFTKVPSGWKVQVRLKSGTAGKGASVGATRTKTFPTKPMAAAWARDLEAQRDKGTVRDPKLDLIPVSSLWPTFHEIRKSVLAPSTLAKNSAHWTKHLEPYFGGMAVTSLRRSHIEAWVTRQVNAGTGVPTIESSLRLLSSLLESAVSDDIITANPCRKVRIPKHLPKRRRFVTEEEIQKVVAEIEAPDHKLMVALMATTGLRIGEVLGLTRADIGIGAATISVRETWTRHGYKAFPKSDSAVRTVPVVPELRQALQDHTSMMLPATRVFHGDDRNLNRRVIVPACIAAGVEVFTIHELRHHAASVWVAAGIPLFEVSQALGQADARMVQRVYGHLVPGSSTRLLAARSGVSWSL